MIQGVLGFLPFQWLSRINFLDVSWLRCNLIIYFKINADGRA